ncbi:MAG: alpha/beta hydrolase [Rhizobiaceae bacterium]|nr:alpha/beta hydrolase [Rhizobiaceae bacterium]
MSRPDKDIHPQAYAAHIQLVGDQARRAGIPAWRADNVVQGRESFRWLATVKLTGAPPAVADVRDIVLDLGHGRRPARFYKPDAAGDLPTLIYVHGGGYVVGGLDEVDAEARRLASSLPANVVSISYRLAPEHQWPAAIEDTHDAIQAVMAGRAGLPAGPVLVLGVSAGAGATVAAVRRLIELDQPLPSALVLLSPWLDLSLSSPSYALYRTGYAQETSQLADFRDLYVPSGMDLAHPELCAVRHSLPDNWPHTIMLAAERDPMADDAALFERRLREANARCELRYMRGMLHGSHTWYQRIPALAEDLGWLDDCIRRQFSDAA